MINTPRYVGRKKKQETEKSPRKKGSWDGTRLHAHYMQEKIWNLRIGTKRFDFPANVQSKVNRWFSDEHLATIYFRCSILKCVVFQVQSFIILISMLSHTIFVFAETYNEVAFSLLTSPLTGQINSYHSGEKEKKACKVHFCLSTCTDSSGEDQIRTCSNHVLVLYIYTLSSTTSAPKMWIRT